uniref:FYVE, RhoGEF and PH domain-containing protein 2-like n=1 Tax=Callorhinchus milii TaxID=7868 RepID=A0A4W3H2T6_CALMI|eukprot:gi/632989078/ref/XP_007883454.1/ PREDICTED: FYVE, RhoGEF and PH domain-containing protein 2-like isoform X2 [Callorhinchus milii]
MYGEYVKNFDKAMDLLDTMLEKCQPFREIIQEIQKKEMCGSLSLQHHMLEPVQRVPRYQLLLKDYVKKLPQDSPDRSDAEKSLEIIFEAANRSNAAIAELEKQQKMWDVYEMLGGEEDIVDPSNELLKEGPILKVSVRSSSTAERHLFLVKEVNDVETPHCFLVSGKQRSLQLQARSQEEMEAWIQAIQESIVLSERKIDTFKAASLGPASPGHHVSQ